MIWRPPEYPWQIEFFDWARAQPKEPLLPMMTTAEYNERTPKTRMSDLLNVIFRVLETPEIWDRFVAYSQRVVEEGYIDDAEDDEYGYACQLVGDYSKWYRWKNERDDNPIPYSKIPRIIRDVAAGELAVTDRAALKSRLNDSDSVVDDTMSGE